MLGCVTENSSSKQDEFQTAKRQAARTPSILGQTSDQKKEKEKKLIAE